MASFRLKRFANVAVLKRTDPALLMAFLTPFREFLVDRRRLAWPDDPMDVDYTELAEILMSPAEDTPDELLDALYFVDNLADGDCYDRLLEEAQEAGIDLGANDLSPEDLALRIWLADRNILERVHAEQYRIRPKTFRSYFAYEATPHEWECPDADLHKALQDNLNLWFDFKRKGRGARVFFFPKEDAVWMLVRHGQRIRREGTVESDGGSGSIFYRPEKFDVLVYYPNTGELAIHADTKGEREIYCRLLGSYLFGDPEYFRFEYPIAKYTLEPLIDLGQDAMACADIDGIAFVHLSELHMRHAAEQKDIEIRRADNVFTALARQRRQLDEERLATRLLRAKFRITFVGGRERMVTIEPPNIASFDRETDTSMVYDWLASRGFMLTENTNEYEDHQSDILLGVA